MSFPGPPKTSPVAARRSSPPSPKKRLGDPTPLALSSPSPAQTESFPLCELMLSSPPKETITSPPLVPLIESFPDVPTIVAVFPSHVGGGSAA